MQLIGASACLGLQSREVEELNAELPDAGSSPRLTQWSGLATARGAPIGASMWGWLYLSHTITPRQGTKCTLPHVITQSSCYSTDRCLQPQSQARTIIHSHTNTAWSHTHTDMHRHAATDMHCHTQDTQTPVIFCSLGWEGTPETMVSILLPPDRSTSLSQTGSF